MSREQARGPAVAIESLHEPVAADVRGLAELIERTTAADRHRPIGEYALVELKKGPKVFPHAAFVARANRDLAGYAHLSERETRTGWRVEAFVAPEHRGRGIGGALVDAVLEHVRRHGGGLIHLWAYRPGEPQERLARRLGLRRIRTLLRMHCPLPCPEHPLPEGIRLRPFRSEDAHAWLALHNQAFAEHPDAGGWREDDLAWHLEEPWFDPAGFLLAEDAGGLCGYTWMKAEGDLGWIYFLGVAPHARGTGLSRALAGAGLAWTRTQGARTGVLYVDEDNVSAVRMYRGLGFALDHVDLCYGLEIPAGPDTGDEPHPDA